MRNLAIVLAIGLSFILASCGGGSSSENDTKTDKPKEEVKQLSKSTQEGMMQLLDQCNISVPDALEYSEVSRNGNNYVITFTASEIDETAKQALDSWYASQVEQMSQAGWNKRVVRENESMFGTVYNETIMLKPSGKKVNVAYGLTLTSSYDTDSNEYKVHISGD